MKKKLTLIGLLTIPALMSIHWTYGTDWLGLSYLLIFICAICLGSSIGYKDKKHPQVGNRVRTKVGFGSEVTGIVISIHDGYCWIKKDDGQYCTASYSYCEFEYLKK